MKKIFKLILPCLALVACLASCQESLMDDKADIDAKNEATRQTPPTVMLSNAVSSVDYQSIGASFTISDTTNVEECGLMYTTDNAFSSYSTARATKNPTVNATISKLSEETTYYVKAYVVTKDGATVVSDGVITATTEKAPVWENVGVGYFIDGTISTFFGVDNTLAYTVEIEKLVEGSTIHFRFVAPFSYVATAQDENGGYVGYPYNSDGDCDEQAHTIQIDITSAGASMQPVSLGFDWGYGEFSIGQVYGNISGVSVDSYPLGVYHETEGYIEFPANSLYISMADYQNGGKYPCTNPTYVFLSVDSFKKIYLGE